MNVNVINYTWEKENMNAISRVKRNRVGGFAS